MTHYVFNDGGREASGFKGRVGDCVARSIAIASGVQYWKVYAGLSWINLHMRKTRRRGPTAGVHAADNGVYTTSAAFRRYMDSLGFKWTPTMGIGTGCRVHLKASELPSGRLVVAVSKHYTTMIDGVIHDTHDPSRGGTRCVYGYWKRDE